jgi:O-antigen ligase
MSRGPLLPPELLAAPPNRWDVAVEALLAVLLAFLPMAFGGVDAWSELIALVLAAALVLIVLVRAVGDRTFALPWTWAYAPLAAMILLVILQRTPLPRAWIAALSPAVVDTRDELLGDDNPSDPPPNLTLSAYPLATDHGLRLLLLGAAVFFVTVTQFRTAPQIRRLLAIVFAVGCAQAALALLQIVTRADKLYWTLDAGTTRLTSGSFVNYSNFSQFMNLSIGAGVALLLVRLVDDRGYGAPRDDAHRAFGGARLGDHGAVLAGLVLATVAVLASLSRNGAVSLFLAMGVVGLALFASGRLRARGWVLALLPLGALAGLVAFGFDSVYARFATLQTHSDQVASRWQLTRDVWRAWQAFPVWGAGLGTHEYVFPMFDSSASAVLAAHADNDYAQLLEETGVLGAASVAAFLAIIAAKLVAVCRRDRPAITAAAFGLALGLIAVAIHSATDFGQHLPAVFCLSAVSCGLVVALARLSRSDNQRPSDRRIVAWRRATAAALLAVAALGAFWTLRSAYAAHRGEQWWAATRQLEDDLATSGAAATDADYADLLAAAGQAAASEPRNVEYGYWLNAYRWRAMTRRVDPQSGQPRLAADAQPLVARLADALAEVRRLCPTYGPPYALEGQLRYAVLGQEERGARLIDDGARLAPYDPPTCFIAGEVAARAARADDARRLLARAVELSPGYFPDVAAIALDVLHAPQFARELADGDYARLDQLATLAAARDSAQLAAELRRDAEAALRRRATSDDVAAVELAALAALDAERGHHASAAALYGRALALDFGQTDWRFARAQSLVALGDDQQALRELRTCLRDQPTHAGARQLADELSLELSEAGDANGPGDQDSPSAANNP